MIPVIIGVGGAYSGVGKTTVICEILQCLENWGAIKYTRTPFYSSVTDESVILAEEGKDTKRFLDAGAAKVVWVQSPYSELPVTLSLATGMFSQVKGILVEGNSAVEVINPDILIFISGSLQEKWKTNAENILAKADIVLCDKEPSPKFPSAPTFHLEQTTEYMQCLKTLIRRISTEG
ncbi:MAG: hypothetical protein RDU01_06690 [Thermodesulfovibrionales bacterium]|nr:hypothetical protein [Thermodesulfovibrionales bacterium]